jgi:hypothetical protein
VKISSGDIVQENLNVTARWTQGTGSVDPGQNPWPATVTFSDVGETDWFYPYVTELSQFGIIGGYDDGTFRPDQTISGGEALKLILLVTGYEEQAPTDSHWASGYLSLALSYGFVGDGEITDLNAPISRLQIAQIAAKALGLTPSMVETPFTDTSDVSVLALYEIGVIQGNAEADGTLLYHPDESINRKEISAIIWRIAQLAW